MAEYILVQDDDCHWYIIPHLKIAEWEKWFSDPFDDNEHWELPKWAKAVGGSPSLVLFKEFRVL
ncbi:MAG: hypothetical protein IMF11_18355 [Proteobacteria bacterium]|nr:hypothetical protein [Pseudomonadota bacterium]